MSASKKNVSVSSPLPIPEGYWAISNAQVPHLYRILASPSLRRKALFRNIGDGVTTPILDTMNEHFTFEAGSDSDRYILHGYTKKNTAVQLCISTKTIREAPANIVLIKTKNKDWDIHPIGVVQIIIPYRA